MTDDTHECEAPVVQWSRLAGQREQALDERESRIRAWESHHRERQAEIDDVVAEAARRDGVAAARDSTASKRDMAAHMDAWLCGGVGGADPQARQDALDDRGHSAGDRAASAIDLAVVARLASVSTTDEDGPTGG